MDVGLDCVPPYILRAANPPTCPSRICGQFAVPLTAWTTLPYQLPIAVGFAVLFVNPASNSPPGFIWTFVTVFLPFVRPLHYIPRLVIAGSDPVLVYTRGAPARRLRCHCSSRPPLYLFPDCRCALLRCGRSARYPALQQTFRC